MSLILVLRKTINEVTNNIFPYIQKQLTNFKKFVSLLIELYNELYLDAAALANLINPSVLWDFGRSKGRPIPRAQIN